MNVLSEVPVVDLILTEREQSALRALTSCEPVPGSPLPTRRALEALATLVPSDELVAGRADDTGLIEQRVFLNGVDDDDLQVCDGPLIVGLVHLGPRPSEQSRLRALRVEDSLWLGFRNGPSHVVQLDFTRRRRRYAERDLALLTLVTPTVQRLVRERPTPQLPADLTVQERRVLMRVAAGHSNAQIAEVLEVAPSTVRKHLEHAYRKLGVTSRVAAVARMQGRDRADLDLRERLERFA